MMFFYFVRIIYILNKYICMYLVEYFVKNIGDKLK